MPTVAWEIRKQSPHYHFLALERFDMAETVKDLETFLMILMLEAAEDESGCSGVLLMCLTTLTMITFQEDMFMLRVSCLYPPKGFYPSGSYDSFWNEGLFYRRFLFRLNHFHRLIRAMDFEDKFISVKSGKKKQYKVSTFYCCQFSRRCCAPSTDAHSFQERASR
jgi:hypothetical protein